MKLSQLYPRSINDIYKRSTKEDNDENSMQGIYNTRITRHCVAYEHLYIAHYHKIAMYDQLYANASRISQSLELPSHEYIPYQLVVVYVRELFAYTSQHHHH